MLDEVPNSRSLAIDGLELSCWEQGEGPVVLLLHGFPDSPQTWRLALPALAKAGFRAVAVTIPGYEQSSIRTGKPKVRDFSSLNLARIVEAVIDQLSSEPIHLVGHDWGASLVFSAVRLCPQKVRSLTMMSVPHPARFFRFMFANSDQRKASRYIQFFQLVGIAEYALRRRDFRGIKKLWDRWSPGLEISEEYLAPVREQFAHREVLTAALCYYRAAALPGDSQSKALIRGPVDVPTLGMYGEHDGCILPRTFRACMNEDDFTGGLTVEAVADAGHFLHLEQPDACHRLLVEHFQKHS
ncbi:MAG: alpha/beta hydrolase [Pseudomonadota bacterium]